MRRTTGNALLAYVSSKPSGYLNLYARPIRDGQWAGPEIALTNDHRFPRDRVYFVHSFAMRCNNSGDVVGLAQYGQSVTAIIAKDNIAATQFHPEKSQDSGIELVSNFLRWNP